jgi:hypothetical protein
LNFSPKDTAIKARVEPWSYIFVSGVTGLLFVAAIIYTILRPDKGSYSAAALLGFLSVMRFAIMNSNGLAIRGGKIISTPLLSRKAIFDPNDITLKVSRMGLTASTIGRPFIIDVSSKSKSFKDTSIPASIFIEADVEAILSLAQQLGATVEG